MVWYGSEPCIPKNILFNPVLPSKDKANSIPACVRDYNWEYDYHTFMFRPFPYNLHLLILSISSNKTHKIITKYFMVIRVMCSKTVHFIFLTVSIIIIMKCALSVFNGVTELQWKVHFYELFPRRRRRTSFTTFSEQTTTKNLKILGQYEINRHILPFLDWYACKRL